MLAHFDWAAYGFNSRHFVPAISNQGMPFCIVLACDPYSNGRSLFRSMTAYTHILDSALALLNCIRSLGITSKLTSYLIPSHRYITSESTKHFWDIQSQIVAQLCTIRALSLVITFVHPEHDNRAVSLLFVKKLAVDGWVITDTNVSYPDYGDSVVGSCRLIVAVHSNTEPSCAVLALQPPPQVPSRPLTRFVWAPFNWPELAISYSKDDPSFNIHAVNDNGLPPLQALPATESQRVSFSHNMKVMYNLHCKHNNPAVFVGSTVIDTNGLCPAFNPNANLSLFRNYFGMEFIHNGLPTSKPYHHSNLCPVSDSRASPHINYLSIAILFVWMPHSLQYHRLGSLSKFLSIASMSVLIISRFASPINSPQGQLASRLFLTVLLVY